jgi:hypothetical protein
MSAIVVETEIREKTSRRAGFRSQQSARSLKEPNMSWRGEEAKVPNPEPVIVRELILHLGGDCDWDIPALAQCNQILAKFRSSTLSSDQQNRPLRLADQSGRLIDGGSTGLGSRDAVNPGGEQAGFHLENILRKLDHTTGPGVPLSATENARTIISGA